MIIESERCVHSPETATWDAGGAHGHRVERVSLEWVSLLSAPMQRRRRTKGNASTRVSPPGCALVWKHTGADDVLTKCESARIEPTTTQSNSVRRTLRGDGPFFELVSVAAASDEAVSITIYGPVPCVVEQSSARRDSPFSWSGITFCM